MAWRKYKQECAEVLKLAHGRGVGTRKWWRPDEGKRFKDEKLIWLTSLAFPSLRGVYFWGEGWELCTVII